MKNPAKLFCLLTLCFVFVSFNLYSQDYLRYDRKGLKWELKNWVKKEKLQKVTWSEGDNHVGMVLNDSGMVKDSLIFMFNSKGICDQVLNYSSTLSGLDCDIIALTKFSRYGWKEVRKYYYVSNKRSYSILTIDPINDQGLYVLKLYIYPEGKKAFKKYLSTLNLK